MLRGNASSCPIGLVDALILFFYNHCHRETKSPQATRWLLYWTISLIPMPWLHLSPIFSIKFFHKPSLALSSLLPFFRFHLSSALFFSFNDVTFLDVSQSLKDFISTFFPSVLFMNNVTMSDSLSLFLMFLLYPTIFIIVLCFVCLRQSTVSLRVSFRRKGNYKWLCLLRVGRWYMLMVE